jgi:hypothetical protein
LLIPSVRCTWAPVGQTPVLRAWQRHERISAISGLSASPRRQRLGLYVQVHDANLHTPEVCAFVRHVLRHLAGPVIIIWDNGNIQKGPVVRALCAAFPRLYLEPLPPYAPELKPDEGSLGVREKGARVVGGSPATCGGEHWHPTGERWDTTRRLILVGGVVFVMGVIVGGYLFSESQPRSFLALRECGASCYHPTDVLRCRTRSTPRATIRSSSPKKTSRISPMLRSRISRTSWTISR